MNTQSEFDHSYSEADALQRQFSPSRTVTMKSRNPDFITHQMKIKLRWQNELTQAGCIENAAALSTHIGMATTSHGQTRLSKILQEYGN
jgi:extradiol dioxygenase family protein